MKGKLVVRLFIVGLFSIQGMPCLSQEKDRTISEDELESEIEKTITEAQPSKVDAPLSSVGRVMQSFNPDISAIVDLNYHNSHFKGASEGEVSDISKNMTGFGHSHNDDHGHEHGGLEEGFNLRHLELYFSGEVDPYFKAYAIAAVSEHTAEMEEGIIQTTCLPSGFQLQAGKFFSHFGRINQKHSHEWDFVDQPLIYNLTLGNHGLNEKGLNFRGLLRYHSIYSQGLRLFRERMISFLAILEEMNSLTKMVLGSG